MLILDDRWMTGVILPVDAGATAAVGLGEWTKGSSCSKEKC